MTQGGDKTDHAAAIDLEPIKARLAAATPGPWEPNIYSERPPIVVAMTSHLPMVGRNGFREVICEHQSIHYDSQVEANARLIANAPTDLAALIAEVERLREALKLILGEFDVDKTDHYHGDPVVVIARDALADRTAEVERLRALLQAANLNEHSQIIDQVNAATRLTEADAEDRPVRGRTL